MSFYRIIHGDRITDFKDIIVIITVTPTVLGTKFSTKCVL